MKADNDLINSKMFAIIATIGFFTCLISFVIALINQKYIGSVLFLLASIYCVSHFIMHIKNKKHNN